MQKILYLCGLIGRICIPYCLNSSMTAFLHSIPFVELVLIGALVLVTIYEIYFYLRYLWLRRPGKPATEDCPPVTVIVCAKNEAYLLRDYLQALVEQDYPEYEVIVVNDGSEDDTPTVLGEYTKRYSHFRSTFVPIGARVCSSKKLALSLAIKSARYEHLLLTDADCRPESNQWIRQIMSGFGEGKQLVLGFGAYFTEHKGINRLIQYDTLFNGLQFLGMARAGKAYMGVGRNLAYLKSTFLQSGGFTGLINECAGDDDLVVNRVATNSNTAIVTTPNSITWSEPKGTWQEWLHQKRRHLSVSRLYTHRSKLRIGMEPVMRAAFYTLIIALVAISKSWQVWVIAGAAWTIRWLIQTLVLNISAGRLGVAKVGIRGIWLDIVLPVITLYILVTKHFHTQNKW